MWRLQMDNQTAVPADVGRYVDEELRMTNSMLEAPRGIGRPSRRPRGHAATDRKGRSREIDARSTTRLATSVLRRKAFLRYRVPSDNCCGRGWVEIGQDHRMDWINSYPVDPVHPVKTDSCGRCARESCSVLLCSTTIGGDTIWVGRIGTRRDAPRNHEMQGRSRTRLG